MRESIQSQIKDMLKAGVIRHSTSPCASPFVIDYRKLNSVTVNYSYQLPVIEDIFTLLNSSFFFHVQI